MELFTTRNVLIGIIAVFILLYIGCNSSPKAHVKPLNQSVEFKSIPISADAYSIGDTVVMERGTYTISSPFELRHDETWIIRCTPQYLHDTRIVKNRGRRGVLILYESRLAVITQLLEGVTTFPYHRPAGMSSCVIT